MATPPKSIDAYLKNVGEPRHTALQKLRRQIRTMVPGVEECISYSMPAFRWRGEVLGGFLATRKGCSFFPFSGTTLDTMAADLARYSRTKSALHFDPERGVPSTLMRKLLRTRQAEITGSAPKGRGAGRRKKDAPADRKTRPAPKAPARKAPAKKRASVGKKASAGRR
jgi:uncharacterized protein YdhG (YjbR/CyaY superfamily)